MINLLPTEDRMVIRKEVLRRYINILGLGLFVLMVMEIGFSVFLLSFSLSFSKNLNDQLETTKNVANLKNLEFLEGQIEEINSLILSVGESQTSSLNVTDNIVRILDILSKDIKIESFLFEAERILLRGHSETRSGLLDFIADLEKIDCSGETCFSKATLPVSNLLEEKDFDFSLTIDLNQENNEKH